MATNEQVAKAFAKRSENHFSANNIFRDGLDLIFSYGPHFPIAKFSADGSTVFITTRKWSVTTGKHVALVRKFLGHFYDGRVIHVDDVLAASEKQYQQNQKIMEEEIEEFSKKQARARSSKEYYQQMVEDRAGDLEAYRVFCDKAAKTSD